MTDQVEAQQILKPWVRVLPIALAQVYLNFTVILFAFGPWPWPISNKLYFYGFLGAAHLALLMGYLSRCFSNPVEYRGKINAITLLKFSMIVNFMLIGPTIMAASGGRIDLGGALADPGAAYQAKMDVVEGSSIILNSFRFVLGPLIWPLLPLFMLYRDKLNKMAQLICMLLIFLGLLTWVMMGTNKGLFDFIILFSCFLVIKWIKNNDPALSKKMLRLGLAFIFMFFLAGAFFIKSTTSRMKIDESPRYFPHAQMYSNDQSVFVRYLSYDQQSFVRGFSAYVCIGYYGLGQALDKPFQSTYGLGHSLFLQLVEKRLTGKETITKRSLPDRLELENGYDKLNYWHSIYTWIASDVGFIGTIVVVYFIGRMMAMSWLDVLTGKNPFAVPVFASYLLCVCYFPANNQAVAFGEYFSAFYVLHFFWLKTRSKYSIVEVS